MGTSCRSHAITINADAYNGQTATAANTFNTSSCDAQPFPPKFIRSRLPKGAIVAKMGRRGKKLKPFKIKIKDADGKTTKLTVRAK